MLEPLAKTIVRQAVEKGGYYAIQYDREYHQEITDDLSLICNQKNDDEYVGVDGIGENCHIILFDSKKKNKGWIYWVDGDDGTERIADYSMDLQDWIDINQVIFDWACDYHRL